MRKNKSLPSTVIIYRDGVGGPTMVGKVMKNEVMEVENVLRQHFRNYKPKVIYCMIDKLVDTRFFHEEDRQIKNPGSGAVIDKILNKVDSEKCFDFYMVPHKATIATARPVYFNVCWNTSGINK
mmetsp:Transcript_15584/g.10950  ORF Transcript_15584/g.10950 Transcript_15584/m.10950 type:complete len:124 (+) Transcript_15584:2062-2433(+)